jgi:hypothetical protein
MGKHSLALVFAFLETGAALLPVDGGASLAFLPACSRTVSASASVTLKGLALDVEVPDKEPAVSEECAMVCE